MGADHTGATMTDASPHGPSRVLLPTGHSDLRATWHAEADVMVLTLWSGQRCTGSAPLSPEQAAELMAFLGHCLARRASGQPSTATPDPAEPRPDATG
jgi:hypothetical protein